MRIHPIFGLQNMYARCLRQYEETIEYMKTTWIGLSVYAVVLIVVFAIGVLIVAEFLRWYFTGRL